MPARPLGSTMRVLHPLPHVLAFYDGRIEGVRAWSDEPNWIDDGAYGLGACSYAVVDGPEALVYDTHLSLDHAGLIRQTLSQAGVTAIRVVLSHWHADHVAGNAVFADGEIIANDLTSRILKEKQAALESGTPPIRPLVHPTRTFATSLHLRVGRIPVELHAFDIHSCDGTVLLLPGTATLLAGDTLEDPITYVSEPDRLRAHLVDLDRLSGLTFDRILPNHGAPAVIAAGGYGRSLLDANRRYVEKLLGTRDEPGLDTMDLRTFIAADLARGEVHYFAPYEDVHRSNVARVRALVTGGRP